MKDGRITVRFPADLGRRLKQAAHSSGTRASDLVRGIQLAHASLVHLANREGIETIFTLDRRDFGVLRLARGKKFRVVP